MLEVLHGFPELLQYVNSLYYCQYDKFFESLGKLSLYSLFNAHLFSHPFQYGWKNSSRRIDTFLIILIIISEK